MPKPSSKERRKQVLKQRRTEMQRDSNSYQAEDLFREAAYLKRIGDLPGAGRLLKKVLVLAPNDVDALRMLADIHAGAGHNAEALGYLLQSRKVEDEPQAIYNTGVLYGKLGQMEKAAEAMREFLAATGPEDAQWRRLRESAETLCAQAARRKEVAEALRTAVSQRAAAGPKPSPVHAPPPVPAAVVEPRVEVQFDAGPPPPFAAAGTLDDYFLRRRWMQLRMAQNFEDLICLPSLHGVDTYVYQQETVRRVLRQFKGRALLADEVGLGKTIEACLVLKEYWMRGMVRKALILTPPSLVSQWKGELTEKFGLEPASPDGATFRQDTALFWRDAPLAVASIAMARMEPHAAAIAASAWDMVIVDEAHCLKNRTSANWRLVDSLQKRFILMLTATPVENNLLELYNLITLLKPGVLATEADFRKIYMTPGKPKSPRNPAKLRELLAEVMVRNTRAAADVHLPHRIAATVRVESSLAEERLYELVSGYVARRYQADGVSQRSSMVLDLMQRQAGSSPHAIGRSVARHLSQPGRLAAADRRDLEEILELAGAIEWSDKGQRLAGMLTARGGKAVVFTEFLPTLDHLQRVCEGHGISYSLFSGDLSRADKDASIARFRDQARVLLSTGSGGEGRNLQFADTIINFDLPWNPMRIEQRIGRVHRIGQEHEVFVFNFCQQGTVEEQLLRVLHDKVNMFELVVGEMDAILGTLDDQRDFAEIIMDLWLSGRESGEVGGVFDELAGRLLEAKKEHAKVQELDESLFSRDFEV